MLLSFNFSPKAIASMLFVSEKTICRRIDEFGLTSMREFAPLTDAELDAITTEFVYNLIVVKSHLMAT